MFRADQRRAPRLGQPQERVDLRSAGRLGNVDLILRSSRARGLRGDIIFRKCCGDAFGVWICLAVASLIDMCLWIFLFHSVMLVEFTGLWDFVFLEFPSLAMDAYLIHLDLLFRFCRT